MFLVPLVENWKIVFAVNDILVSFLHDKARVATTNTSPFLPLQSRSNRSELSAVINPLGGVYVANP